MTKFRKQTDEELAKPPVKPVYEVAENLPTDYEDKILQYRQYKVFIAEFEAKCKEIAVELEAGLIVTGEKSLKSGNLTLTRIERSGSKKLAPERVMEKICTRFSAEEATDILQYATIQSQGYSYIQVTAASNEDE